MALPTHPAHSSPSPLRVRLLWLPEAMHGTLFAAVDVLQTVQRIGALHDPGALPTLAWQVINAAGRRLPVPFASEPARRGARVPPERTLLVVPGLHAHNAPALGDCLARSSTALRLLEQHAAAGGWIAACATGLALPAELGLLDHARIGAPWAFQSWLARRCPRCDFSSDEPMSSSGRIFTCVAPALMTEFMLRVLGHLHDPDVAQASSQVLLHQPERQRLTPSLVAKHWLAKTSDSPVYRAMQWLQQHVDEPYRLSAVADAAAASERTLLRHFRQVTGMTPLDYLHGLRIERAKMLLEVTLHGIPAIAEACGHSDAASFGRLFQREAGMTMSAYRTRYALRSRRRFWRVERQKQR